MNVKLVGTVLTIIGGVVSVMANFVNDRRQEELIDEKISERLRMKKEDEDEA